MPIVGNISDADRASQNLYHGEITADDLPFGNKSNPFRIALLLKESGVPGWASYGPALIDCRLIGDTVTGPFPLDDLRVSPDDDPFPAWSERNIVYIDDTQNSQNLLEFFRIFWTSGDPSPLD